MAEGVIEHRHSLCSLLSQLDGVALVSPVDHKKIIRPLNIFRLRRIG